MDGLWRAPGDPFLWQPSQQSWDGCHASEQLALSPHSALWGQAALFCQQPVFQIISLPKWPVLRMINLPGIFSNI